MSNHDEDNLFMLLSLTPAFVLASIVIIDTLTAPQVRVLTIINRRPDLIPSSLVPILSTNNETRILIPDGLFELANKYGLTPNQILSYLDVRFVVESTYPPEAFFFRPPSSQQFTRIDITQYVYDKQSNKYIAYIDIPFSRLL